MLLQAGLLCAVSLAMLIVAGDLLVRGAVNLALRLGIPALIVSLTIVAFGTSAPELLISVDATLDGKPGLAIGNVVGSNIANVLLVLGLPALIAGMHCGALDTRRSYLQMLGATAIFIGLAQWGIVSRGIALILLAMLALCLWDQFRGAMAHRRARRIEEEDMAEAVEGADPAMRGWRIAIYLIAGLVGLPVGAGLLVENASILARAFGISEAAIGLTLVAVGTSLPELATTVAAALRRQADVALGNVIGSNLFNLLAILGIAALVAPIPIDQRVLDVDLWVMLAAALILAPVSIWRRDLTRGAGIALTALYLLYVLHVLF